MGLKELKVQLNKMDKVEIIKLFSEVYKKVPEAKKYLDVFVTGDITPLIEKYKKEIEKYIYPNGHNMSLREAEARKIIRVASKMKLVELNIVLELHYVRCCLDVIEEFGYWDESYYVALEKMFYNALNQIIALGVQDHYNAQLIEMISIAGKYRIELQY